jgi:site-specific recombinase XerD
MLGHRDVTTTEIYLHYVADAEGSAKLTELWGERSVRDRGARADVVPLRSAA